MRALDRGFLLCRRDRRCGPELKLPQNRADIRKQRTELRHTITRERLQSGTEFSDPGRGFFSTERLVWWNLPMLLPGPGTYLQRNFNWLGFYGARRLHCVEQLLCD